MKLPNLTGRWRGSGGRKVGGGGIGESRDPADGWGGVTVQHGRSTHGNKHVDGYGAVKLCNIVICVEVINPLTCSVVYNVNVLIISGQLQILLIAFTGFWRVQFENGSRENVSARLFHLQCSQINS
jgi:hypothetical protein